MPYLALKPCEFGGKKYMVDDLIPDEVIEKPLKLVKAGVIAPQKGNETETVINSASITFPVLSDDGITSVETTAEKLTNVLITIQQNADDAVQSVNECEDEDVLYMLSTLDSRKSVKNAVDKRMKALNGQGDA